MNRPAEHDQPDGEPPAMRSWRGFEILLIFAVLAVYAAEPTPAVNEAHYLSKAKHYWNPNWAAGDLFLESADAHLAFYWSFGWITQFVSLPATAWIGRLLTWLLLAWAWQRLSWAVVPLVGWSVFSAAMFVVFSHWCSMAGEWVIGGVEAKGFAYVFLLLAMQAVVKNRWRWVWPLLGIASALHVVTCGWGVIAAGIAWLLQRPNLLRACRRESPGSEPTENHLDAAAERPLTLVPMLPWLMLGFVLALPGLLPALALTRNMAPEIVQAANRIYVYQRLPHHLLFSNFAPHLVQRFTALSLGWMFFVWFLRDNPRHRRLAGFVAGALFIAVAGIGLERALEDRPTLSAALLRFYWFRLSDAVVPMGAALAMTGWAAATRVRWPMLACGSTGVAAAAALFTLWTVAAGHVADPRGGADRQSLPAFPRRPQWTLQVYQDWLDTTQWTREHTPPDAVFLTPRSQQTFVWYAGRGQVVNWKDMPQDAASLVAWSRRMNHVYPPVTTRGEWTPMTDRQLEQLAEEYGATYLVLDRTRHVSRKGLTRVYPAASDSRSAYQVYQFGPLP